MKDFLLDNVSEEKWIQEEKNIERLGGRISFKILFIKTIFNFSYYRNRLDFEFQLKYNATPITIPMVSKKR